MQNNYSVWKVANDRLSTTLVEALPYGTVWVDKPSPFVVSGVENNKLLLAKTNRVLVPEGFLRQRRS